MDVEFAGMKPVLCPQRAGDRRGQMGIRQRDVSVYTLAGLFICSVNSCIYLAKMVRFACIIRYSCLPLHRHIKKKAQIQGL